MSPKCRRAFFAGSEVEETLFRLPISAARMPRMRIVITEEPRATTPATEKAPIAKMRLQIRACEPF